MKPLFEWIDCLGGGATTTIFILFLVLGIFWTVGIVSEYLFVRKGMKR